MRVPICEAVVSLRTCDALNPDLTVEVLKEGKPILKSPNMYCTTYNVGIPGFESLTVLFHTIKSHTDCISAARDFEALKIN